MDPSKSLYVSKFDVRGTILTSAERAEIAWRKGCCVFCGVKTHKIKFKGLVRISLTDANVHAGLCICCDTDKVAKSIVNAWECNNSKDSRNSSFNESTNHIKTHSGSHSSNSHAQPETSRIVERKAAYAKAQRRNAEVKSFDDYPDGGGGDFGVSDKFTSKLLEVLQKCRNDPSSLRQQRRNAEVTPFDDYPGGGDSRSELLVELQKCRNDSSSLRQMVRKSLETYPPGVVNQTFLYPFATYRLPAAPTHRLSLVLAQGSVLDFDNRNAPAAIVNATNVGCHSEGGVDGAISSAGGPNLDRDRAKLPVVAVINAGYPVRCSVGQAVVTGPGEYGNLKVPYVIHAVGPYVIHAAGPNYCDYDDGDDDDITRVHNLLKSAYKSALDRAVENKIQSVAFSLLSAGTCRGSQPLETVLAHGVTAIQQWSASYAKQTGGKGDAPLSKIVLCAYTENECKSLQAACDNIMSSTLPALLYPLATYRLPAAPTHRLSLILAQGSVLDFDNRIAPAAIVNAANAGWRGGGVVDGAISNAGGPNLDRDRAKLPVVAVIDTGDPVRCSIGQAVVTGPGEYGSLQVPYVIHAVGPNYCEYDDGDDLTPAHNFLKSAYKSALDRAVENNIQSVALPLLSSGIFLGSQSLETILRHGVTAIQEWSASYAKQTGRKGDTPLSQIVLCAHTENECESLLTTCENIMSSTLPALLCPLATYHLPAAPTHHLSLLLAQGSVLDFDNRIAPAAIVNSTNIGCRGGGGVNGAISDAGGPNLHCHRAKLPIVAVIDAGYPVRCSVGQAVATGPGEYGSLQVPYVIHAVGPNYCDYDDDYNDDYDGDYDCDDLTPAHNFLKSAYKSALDRAVENNIQSVAFSLLSAGSFRGSQSLETVLTQAVTAIQEWSESYANQIGSNGDALLSQIVLCAYTEDECESLQAVCDNILK